MDLRQLAALVAVAEHRSFSAAADALHTVQSNVSTHVARLEKELGVQLVDRQSGQLTDEGQAVVDRARRIAAELDALVSDVAALRDGVALLLPAPGTSLRDDIDRAAAESGIVLVPKAELDGVRLIASLTFDGHGPAILPAT